MYLCRNITKKIMEQKDVKQVIDKIHNAINQSKNIKEEIYNSVASFEQSSRDEILQYIQMIIDELNKDTLLDKNNKDLCIQLFNEMKGYIFKYIPTKTLITPKDIYISLWKCRDFELSHLWQRSIFLTTFLVMCFTGYGSIILKICENPTSNEFSTSFCILNIMGLLIALLSFVLSALWIMMGKGSKAWYEKYEAALYNIERNSKYSESIVVSDMDKELLMHGSLPNPKILDTSLFTTNAGKYSVSKINIAIGQISMVFWGFTYFIHMLLFSFSNQFDTIACNSFGTSIMSIIICLLFLLIAVIITKYTKWCQSSSL